MSLQKGFFMTEPFNPSPFWDNTIVNLSGAQKFEENTVFPAGRYSVDVQAGSSFTNGGMSTAPSRRVVVEFVLTNQFCIRAYCGSKGEAHAGGINPYVGEFKVDGVVANTSVPSVNHIFGNAGSTGMSATGYLGPSGGNCLGNGVSGYGGIGASGAGSCLHFMPVGGVFGSDYLYAVHVAVAGTAVYGPIGGGGSAYGGAGSGGAESSFGSPATSFSGGDTPFGTGGYSVVAPAGGHSRNGNDGTGIGAGFGGDPSGPYGGAAYFDGTTWVDANSNGLFGGSQEDGHIIVKFLGNLN